MPTRCKRSGKVRHPSDSRANEVISRIQRLDRVRKPVRCYYCTFCGGWHLTSQSPNENNQSVTIKNVKLFEKYLSTNNDNQDN